MSFSGTYDGDPISDAMLELLSPLALTESAENGEVGISTLTLEDPNGDIVPATWKVLTFAEDLATPTQIYWGQITSMRAARGSKRKKPTEDARIWTLTVADLNVLLAKRVLRGGEANRPAESEAARMAWLLGSVGLSGVVFDNGLVNADSGVPFGESDYRGKFPKDVLNEISGARGRNFFVYWDHNAAAGEEPSLFYDDPDQVVRVSTLKISNVAADLTNLIREPSRDSECEFEGADVHSGVYLTWNGEPPVYAQRATTVTAHTRRDGVYDNQRIGQFATAQAVAENWLDAAAEDRITITTTLLLPATHVNLVEKGQLIDTKYTHFPGFEDYIGMRVQYRTVRRTRDPHTYSVDLTLTKSIPLPPDVPGPLPPLQPCSDGMSVVQTATTQRTTEVSDPRTFIDFADAPGEGNLLVVWVGQRDNAITESGWTEVESRVRANDTGGEATQGGQMFYKTAGASEPTRQVIDGSGTAANNSYRAIGIEVQGAGGAPTDTERSELNLSNPCPINLSSPGSGDRFFFAGLEHDDVNGFGPDTGWTETAEGFTGSGNVAPATWAGHRIIADHDGSGVTNDIQVTSGPSPIKWAAIMASWGPSGDGDCPPPASGQEVPWEPADTVTPGATTTEGTTRFPYLPGSLKVRVDGVAILDSHVTETDPAAGEFELDWVIDPTETVTVQFRGI